MALCSAPTFCLVTGASKGFGQAVATVLAPALSQDSLVVLTARSGDQLRETERLVKEQLRPSVTVRLVVGDLGNKEDLKKTSLEIFKDVDPFRYGLALVIHNAASLGDISLNVTQLSEIDDLQDYWQLNLTAAAYLTSQFYRWASGSSLKRTVVNVSSLCAVKPFKSWSVYCTGKAARDMLFQTLAAEEPETRVLNYAPGPLDTDMQTRARSETGDPELKQVFQNMQQQQILLSPQQSAKVLLQLLLEDKFESGTHVDYYDVQK